MKRLVGPAAVLSVLVGLLLLVGGGPTWAEEGVSDKEVVIGAGMDLTGAVANPLDFAGFFRPEALAVSPAGELYAAEGLQQVTRRYAPDGCFRGLEPRAVGQELAFGASGELYVANAGTFGGATTLRRIDANGSERWTKACDCLSGLGLAEAGGRVYATDAFSRSLGVFDQQPANERPSSRIAAEAVAASATPTNRSSMSQRRRSTMTGAAISPCAPGSVGPHRACRRRTRTSPDRPTDRGTGVRGC